MPSWVSESDIILTVTRARCRGKFGKLVTCLSVRRFAVGLIAIGEMERPRKERP